MALQGVNTLLGASALELIGSTNNRTLIKTIFRLPDRPLYY